MMKRSGVFVLVVVALGVLTFGSHGSDDVEARKPGSAGLRGKTAYLNLGQVVKGYKKFQHFATVMKGQVEKVEVRIKKLKNQLEAQVKEFSQPGVSIEDRQSGERHARDIQRQIEDMLTEGKSRVGRSSDEQVVELYREIREATAAYARQEGLDAVLHFNDATPGTPEFFAPMNVSRKMQAGAAMPLYLAPGLDITEVILNELNARYKERDADE